MAKFFFNLSTTLPSFKTLEGFWLFKKPVTICENGKGKIFFEYDPITLERTATYFGFEENDKQSIEYIKYFSSIIPVEITKERYTGKIKIITFVGGDAYSAPIMHVKRTGNEPLNTFFYLHRDYLGSVLAITDQNAHLVERRQFGAWGTIDKFRNSTGATEFNFSTTLLDRGYTGHEHLFFVSLINMNGRLYDAKLGRFLSPDNFVQDPFSTQSFNRYGYVVNNPLSFIDKDGEIIWFIAAAVIGMYVGGAQANGTWNPLKWDYNSGKTWGGIVGGGIIGIASFGIGTAITGAVSAALATVGINGGFWGGALSGLAAGIGAGGFSGGFMSLLPGGSGDFFKGMWQGAAIGGLTGFGIGGISGLVSTPKGFNKWTGNHLPEEAITSQTSGVQPINNAVTPTENLPTSATQTTIREGSFSINNWDGYPSGYPKPEGPFRLLDGGEYIDARQLGNKINSNIHQTNPTTKGMQIHEIHPIKFGGSPIDMSNKLILTPEQHRLFNSYWMKMQLQLINK